ncbi:MAG: hypothetical protein JRH20_07790, partial [Deltaproteobacteria bacterium]|nr:hypothetical protein [Deltaproteobacteria bacterium]
GYTSYDDLCDPYTKVKLGNDEETESSWIEDTETPVWDDAKIDVDRARLLSEKLHVEVWDNDDGIGVNPDEELGRCDLSVTEADLSAGELITTCGEAEMVTQLKITFTASN